MRTYGNSRGRCRLAALASLVSLTATTMACDSLFPREPDKKPPALPEAKRAEPVKQAPTTTPPTQPTPPADPGATAANPDPQPTASAASPPKVAQETRFKLIADDASPANTGGLQWAFGASSPNPSWSLDSAKIAYHDGNCVSVRGPDGALVTSLRLPGGKRGGGDSSGECSSPSWSGDGKKIAVGHSFHGPGAVFDVASGKREAELKFGDSGLWSVQFTPDDGGVLGRVHQSGVAMIRTKGSRERVVLVTDKLREMKGYFPTISPDGNHFARVVDSESGMLELATLDPANAEKVKVADPWEDAVKHDALVATRTALIVGVIPEYAWSPDSARVAAIRTEKWYGGYDDYDYGHGALVIIDVATGKDTSYPLSVRNPSWSPDGKWIAVEAEQPGIWLVDASAAQPTLIKLHDKGVEPRWSPDGRKLLAIDPATNEGVVLELAT
ncbi:MAG: PD40 domain-containing protein [Myxococcales bacterium]|nr:PD40 domain-containing protein [Myxococcales bacterium]